MATKWQNIRLLAWASANGRSHDAQVEIDKHAGGWAMYFGWITDLWTEWQKEIGMEKFFSSMEHNAEFNAWLARKYQGGELALTARKAA